MSFFKKMEINCKIKVSKTAQPMKEIYTHIDKEADVN